MAIRALSFKVESSGDLVLRLSRQLALVLEDENLVREESFTDSIKVDIWRKSVPAF